MTRSLRTLLCLAVLLTSVPLLADETRDLLVAARSGDLTEVRRLVDSGVDPNASDDWGTTPLALAGMAGAIEVVDFLLEHGADPDAREQFFGMTVLDAALWKGAPDFAVAKRLLAAGADDRGTALAFALRTGNLELARAAIEAGPIYEFELAEIRQRIGELGTETGDEMGEVLAAVETRPDPPAPAYGEKELVAFTGEFESAEPEMRLEIALADGTLVLEREGARSPLVAVRERTFRSEGGVEVSFFGRAGTVEGISVEVPGEDPVRLRPGLGELVEAPEFPAFEPPAEPTVHWPGFRGANRAGIGDGADPPVDFDLETGEGVAWRVEVPGLANSSPIVWGDTVFLTTAVAEGGSVALRTGLTGAGDEVEEAKEHRWLVLAYDKRSGELLWESEVGRGIPLTKRHFKATQANSTPATDGEHVVAVFPTAGLACLGTDGSIHWKHELGGLNAGGFNDPGLQWGFAASPILHDGKVILQVDIHDGPYIAAWELESGRELWRTERPDVAPSWATPAVWETPDGDELVTNASIIRGYDPATGEELWSLSPTSVQVVASPVTGEENLFVSSGYPPARPIYAVEPGIRGDHEIDFSDPDPALAWAESRGGAYMPTPLLYRGLLYIVHHNGRLAAHDPATGGTVLRARFSEGGTCTSSPVAANGVVYQGTEEGTLYVFRAGPEYEELAVHDFGAPLMATPAISEGMLLVRTPSELIALRRPVEVPAERPAEHPVSGEDDATETPLAAN
ncbi:MAG: PQQ-binding-like beta-propeller repeat protein [Thermoanaerobaculia bacterium]|nr:PQQ-binding-like beta-propeller repeat protein [Thermoanaerobaculia bacterium]